MAPGTAPLRDTDGFAVEALLSEEPAGDPTAADETFQDESLVQVSRTFALTIPQLPRSLSRAVANGYLLCRIADTIEDDPGVDHERKAVFLEAFLAELERGGNGARLATALAGQLSEASHPGEHRLIRELPRVLRITHSLDAAQRRALLRCVAIMGRGMAAFSREGADQGLETLEDLERYCYHVAGVVGEMLTDLFCHHSAAIARRRKRLQELAASFGQGLQLTNILKDIWTDLDRGSCWLPRQLFGEAGAGLDSPSRDTTIPRFSRALLQLVSVAHGNLRDALAYVQTIPRREAGIRRFLMWAVGLAALTLANIASNTSFTDGTQVKVSRRTVRRVIGASNLAIHSNAALGLLFSRWTRPLPEPVVTTAFVAGLSPDGWATGP